MYLKRFAILSVCLLLGLAACTVSRSAGETINEVVSTASELDTAVTTTPVEAPMLDLPDLGEAPEFKNDTWINASERVTLASLQGKVVLLEFWTFG